MRTAAGLHADPTRRQLSEERQHLLASELPGDDDLALGIDAVDLEHLLCKVNPDGGNSCHGRPSLVIRLQRSLYGTLMPCEAPSTSSRMAIHQSAMPSRKAIGTPTRSTGPASGATSSRMTARRQRPYPRPSPSPGPRSQTSTRSWPTSTSTPPTLTPRDREPDTTIQPAGARKNGC